jgi:hypothetical protein
VAVRHIDPPMSWNRVFKTDREFSGKELVRNWKGRVVDDALLGEDGGAVKLLCRSTSRGLGAVCGRRGVLCSWVYQIILSPP